MCVFDLCFPADYVSDLANGGQILVDENTFKAIKDSLSVLGTVNEAGYDDRQLQQLLHSRVVNRLQQHMLCGACDCCKYVCEVSPPRGPVGAVAGDLGCMHSLAGHTSIVSCADGHQHSQGAPTSLTLQAARAG